MNKQSLINWFNERIDAQQCIKIVLSKALPNSEISKITIEPVLIKDRLMYQCALQVSAQVKHENVRTEDLCEKIVDWFGDLFEQLLVRTTVEDRTFYANTDGSIGVSKQKHSKPLIQKVVAHNRQKEYLLQDGTPVPFLIELGVMTPEGKVRAAKYDKFKQINRYLEMVADCVDALPKDRPLTIIDFGCGKSYLTFAVHYFFSQLRKTQVKIIGLDLKAEVINECNEIAKKLGCDGLSFQIGDIAQFAEVDAVDMVLSLHACDTATDYALAKAVGWNAQVILAVPCCHKELAQQMSNDDLSPILSYGIVHERFAALATDALRAELLKTVGYRVQLLEFIDLENSPKNILIRAIKQLGVQGDRVSSLSHKPDFQSFERSCQALHVEPLLKKLL